MKAFMRSLLVAVCGCIFALAIATTAQATDEYPLVVTMGDSYTVGEGNPPYMRSDAEDKFYDTTWIQHISEDSWISRLKFNGIALRDVKANPSNESEYYYREWERDGELYVWEYTDYSYSKPWTAGSWYNVAASASYFYNIYSNWGSLTRYLNDGGDVDYTARLAPQITVFDYLDETYGAGATDYVVLSTGGGDIGIIDYLKSGFRFGDLIYPMFDLETAEELDDVIQGIKDRFYADYSEYATEYYKPMNTYETFQYMLKTISDRAGSQADVIIVGFPTLFSGALPNIFFSIESMNKIDDCILWIDEQFQLAVDELNEQGYTNIHYVSSCDIFEGHGVFSLNEYLLGFRLATSDEEFDKSNSLNNGVPVSWGSFHPNQKGLTALTNKVQKVLDEIDSQYKGWKQDDEGNWQYYVAKDSIRYSGWAKANGTYYYLDENGNVLTESWLEYNGAYYYVGADGKVLTNSWATYEGAYYHVGANGKLQVNSWVYYNGNYYYVGANGQPVVKSWIQYNGSYYYFNAYGICTRVYKAA